MENTVTLGGRHFQITEKDDLTFDQNVWLEIATLESGLGVHMQKKLAPVLERAAVDEKFTDDEAEDLAQSIVVEACRTGKHLDVLAGMLTEVGVTWTRKQAEKNMEFFATLKGGEIAKITSVLQQCIVAFFWSGLELLKSSPNSGSAADVLSSIASLDFEPDLDAGSESSGP
jgi:hypothetical protein